MSASSCSDHGAGNLGRHARAGLRHRTEGPDGAGRDAQNRTRVAQVAAKLIAEHGIADWSLAKRKAVRQLMVPDRQALPGDDEIEVALADYHALFGGSAHASRLREQREEALQWLQRLAQYSPALVGGVAAGWATTHSDIHVELVAGDAKSVELTLLNAGVPYRTMPAVGGGAHDLYLDTPRGGVRLSVRSEGEARQRSRRDRHGNPAVRLDAALLAALLAGVASRP
jgi:hypothetical protein